MEIKVPVDQKRPLPINLGMASVSYSPGIVITGIRMSLSEMIGLFLHAWLAWFLATFFLFAVAFIVFFSFALFFSFGDIRHMLEQIH